MPAVTDRTSFKEYCLRRLGFPTIKINVDDDQVEDRIDDALQFYQDYHFDGVQKVYYVKLLTSSMLGTNTDVNLASHFSQNNMIVGATSGAVATVTTYASNTHSLNISVTVGAGYADFIVGEPLNYYDANGVSHSTGASVTWYQLGDIDARYINMDPSVTRDAQGNPIEIIGVTRIFPIQDSQASINMFDLRYQLRLNELYDFTSASYINYTLTMQHLRSLEIMFTGEVPIRFARHQRKLFIDWAWGYSEAPAGQPVVVECYAVINPDVYYAVWNDRWLKEYATCLIKRQWGENLKKFGGITLPGGVTLNGKDLWDEADKEIEILETQMQEDYELPAEWYMN
jgi:hypothetical protein